MQNKKILAIELPIVKPYRGGKKYKATARVCYIDKKRHLIVDIFYGRTKVCRIATNKDDFNIYKTLEDNKASKSTTGESSYIKTGTDGYSDSFRYICSNTSDIDIRNHLISYGIKETNGSLIPLLDYLRYITYKKDDIKRMKESKEQEELDLLLPDIPDDFESYLDKNLNRGFITYKRRTRAKTNYKCLICGKEWEGNNNPVDSYPPYKRDIKPINGGIRMCPFCKKSSILKQTGRFKWDREWYTYTLIQKISDGKQDGLCIRAFYVKRTMDARKPQDEGQEIETKEVYRVFAFPGKVKKYIWAYSGYQGGQYIYNWTPTNATTDSNYVFDGTHTLINYYNNIKVINNSQVKYYYRDILKENSNKVINLNVIVTWFEWPGIEIINKIGLSALNSHLLTYGVKTSKLDKRASKPYQCLKIYPERIKDLQNASPVFRQTELWEAYQVEYQKKIHMSDDEVDMTIALNQIYQGQKKMDFLLKFMTLKQVINRIRDYQYESPCSHSPQAERSLTDVFNEYYDYLSIREELGDDMTNSVYIHPRSLIAAHAEMVTEKENRANEQYIKRMCEKYPKSAQIYKKLNKKYRYETGPFIFRPAKDTAEIIMEGRIQHHCVGGENYLSKHNSEKSSIILMRYKKTPDIPYITIEIADKKIVQWYLAHDHKTKDEETLGALSKYEKYISCAGATKAADKTKLLKASEELLAPAV